MVSGLRNRLGGALAFGLVFALDGLCKDLREGRDPLKVFGLKIAPGDEIAAVRFNLDPRKDFSARKLIHVRPGVNPMLAIVSRRVYERWRQFNSALRQGLETVLVLSVPVDIDNG